MSLRGHRLHPRIRMERVRFLDGPTEPDGLPRLPIAGGASGRRPGRCPCDAGRSWHPADILHPGSGQDLFEPDPPPSLPGKYADIAMRQMACGARGSAAALKEGGIAMIRGVPTMERSYRLRHRHVGEETIGYGLLVNRRDGPFSHVFVQQGIDLSSIPGESRRHVDAPKSVGTR